jgi:hypothetical protein
MPIHLQPQNRFDLIKSFYTACLTARAVMGFQAHVIGFYDGSRNYAMFNTASSYLERTHQAHWRALFLRIPIP